MILKNLKEIDFVQVLEACLLIHQEIGDMKSFKVTPRMLDNYSTIWQSKQSNNLPEPLEEESQGVQERGDKENEALIDQLNLNPEHTGNSLKGNLMKFQEILKKAFSSKTTSRIVLEKLFQRVQFLFI